MKEIKLPQDLNAELITLGSMLQNIDAVNSAIDSLDSIDFVNFRHQKIFSSMQKLYSENREISPDVVEHFVDLKDENILAYLYELTQYSTSAEIDVFVHSIKEKSKLRKFILFSQVNQVKASEEPEDIEIFSHDMNKELDSIFSDIKDQHLKDPHTITDNFQDSNLNYLMYIQDLQEKVKNGETIMRGISSGYKNIDTYLSGICAGHMIVISARPGVGKSTLALNMLKRLLEKDVPCMFFSLEMTADEVIGKLIALDSRVSYKDTMEGKINGIDYQKIVSSYHAMNEYPLFIDDQGDLTPSQIRTRTRRAIENHDIKVVFVDYLTCISPDKRTNTREEGVRDISTQLRKMAKKFQIPFICIAQENRDSEKSDGKLRVPKKSDLGQSGGIEQDAHTILMLRRREIEDQNDKPGVLEGYLVKNRFGQTGKLEFNFDGPTGTIDELPSMDELRSIKDPEQKKEYDQLTL